VQSLARGLAVLRAFAPGYERLTIADAAARAGLTRAGARRILLTLQHLGYVRSDSRHFFLTARVLDLAQGFGERALWDATRPVLQSVADALNETTSAGVLDGAEVVYVLRIQSARLLHLGVSAGTRLPAHVSSMGRVLLAALPPAPLEDYFRTAPLRRFTKFTVTDPAVLRARLDEVRAQGWAYVKGEIEEGVSGVSVPLTNRTGRVIAALNVSTNAERASMQEVRRTIVPALQAAAAQIAVATGSPSTWSLTRN
jgi:IclR family pca regulon transcriptional regulator